LFLRRPNARAVEGQSLGGNELAIARSRANVSRDGGQRRIYRNRLALIWHRRTDRLRVRRRRKLFDGARIGRWHYFLTIANDRRRGSNND
jgi:hypothetical protein